MYGRLCYLDVTVGEEIFTIDCQSSPHLYSFSTFFVPPVRYTSRGVPCDVRPVFNNGDSCCLAARCMSALDLAPERRYHYGGSSSASCSIICPPTASAVSPADSAAVPAGLLYACLPPRPNTGRRLARLA